MSTHAIHARILCAIALFVAACTSVWAQGTQTFQTLRLVNPAAPTNGISLVPPSNITAYTLTLPATAPSTAGQVLSSATDGTMSWITPSSGWALTGNSGIDSTTAFIGTTSEATGRPLAFRTNNTERMRIAGGSGFVGIGTTSPASQLSLMGTPATLMSIGGNLLPSNFGWTPAGSEKVVIFSGSSGYGTMVLASNATEASGQTLGSLLFGQTVTGKSGTAAGLKGGIQMVSAGSGGSVGGFGSHMLFMTMGDNATGWSENMRISSTGLIGIGTVPTERLHVMNGHILIDNNDNIARELRFDEPSTSGDNYTAFRAGAQTVNITYTLPTTAPSAGQVLSSDAGGNLSWATGGGGLTSSTGWALAGNTGYTASGSLGGAPTGSVLGSTTALPLNVVTNNVIRMIVASDGAISMGSGAVSINADQNFATNINSGTSTGTVNIGNGSGVGQTINIGNSASTSRTVNIGTSVGGAVVLQSGSSGISLNASVNQPVNIGTGTSTGTINIGNGTGVPQTINIGNINNSTGTSKTVVIGSSDGSTTIHGTTTIANNPQWGDINFAAGTVGTTLRALNIGTATATSPGYLHTNIGSLSTVSQTNIRSGTGAVNINTTNANPVNIATGTSQANLVVIGNSSATVALNGGPTNINNNSTAAGNVNISSGASSNATINIGSGGTGSANKTIAIGSSSGTTGAITMLASTGGSISINADNNSLTNINTGTSTGAVTIGGAGNQTISIGNGAANKTVNLGSSTGTSVTTIRAGTGNMALTTASSGIVTLGTNNTERMRVASDGLVGIGATSPGAQLHVTAGAAATKGLIVRGAASQTANLLEIQNSSATVLTSVSTDGSISVEGSITPTPGTPATVAADNTAITVGAKSFLRITSDGTPVNRTITLSNGLTDGQILVIRVSGNGTAANGIELADAGNLVLTGNATLTDGSTIVLIWDSATSWFEIARSIN